MHLMRLSGEGADPPPRQANVSKFLTKNQWKPSIKKFFIKNEANLNMD